MKKVKYLEEENNRLIEDKINQQEKVRIKSHIIINPQ